MNHRYVTEDDAQMLAEYYAANREHLREWEPERSSEFYTESFWSDRLVRWQEEMSLGQACHFLNTDDDNTRIMATCSLTNIVRGPFQACNIGYSVAADVEGTGVMKSLLGFVIGYAFRELELNRVMANCMPRNARSRGLLASMGFREEGMAERYLLINGVWEDHVLTSLVNPNNR